MAKPKVLIADDDDTVRALLARHLPKIGVDVIATADGSEALAAIDAHGDTFAAAVFDLQMPGADGIECVKALREKNPEASPVMLSAAGDLEAAVTAMKEGAVDYIQKPFDMDAVCATLGQALSTNKLKRENRQLRAAVATPAPRSGFLGDSPATRKLMEDVARIAGIDSTVMITGESGVGKTLLARLIHSGSGRAKAPFVTVSCPALPRELLESEMFGHEAGAFTGALQKRLGKFELANKGSLFLDEVGDLPIDLQPKLLSALQDREFTRLGGVETISADVRLIAATNVDLPALIEDKSFREDLYYRLNVIPLHLPPLRERREDISPLIEHFLKRIASDRGTDAITVSDEATEVLLSYDWPGNVRQLENVLERATAFCDGSVKAADLPSEITGKASTGDINLSTLGDITLADLEKAAIEATLHACGNNKAESARRLGISEKSIYNKMKRFGLR